MSANKRTSNTDQVTSTDRAVIGPQPDQATPPGTSVPNPFPVANLPPASANPGVRLYVNNSNAALTAGIGAVVAGGGANTVPVFSNGTSWLIG